MKKKSRLTLALIGIVIIMFMISVYYFLLQSNMDENNINFDGRFDMKKIWVCVVLLALILLMGSVWLFLKPLPITLPEVTQIEKVQLNGIVIDADKMNKNQLSELYDNVIEAIPLKRIDSVNIERGKDYYVLAFLDNENKRTCLYFFQHNSKLYMQDDKKVVYKNVDFMNEYLLEKSRWMPVSVGEFMGNQIPNTENIRYAIDNNYDANYCLYDKVQSYLKKGYTQEEAEKKAKDELLLEYELYQYAIENDYKISDKDYEQLTNERIAVAKQQEKYVEAEAVYEAAGTTMEETMRNLSKEMWRRTDTVAYMDNCIYNKFRDGQYEIDDEYFDNAEDFCNAYKNKIILEELGHTVWE